MGGSGYDLGNVYGKITLDASGVGDGIRKAREELNRGFQGMGDSLQRFGDQLTGMGARMTALTAPFTAFSASGLNVAADFDVLMKQIEMFGGVTGAELESVRQYALQMGADTKFSAQDAGGALLELLKSGQDLQTAMATLPDVLNLAAVGEMSLAEAAGVVSGGLSIFKLETEDLNKSLIDVPDNFLEIQKQFGITDAMMSQLGQSVPYEVLDEMAASLGVTTGEVENMWQAAFKLTPELESLGEQLGISSEDWATLYDAVYGSRSGNYEEALTPAIRQMQTITGLHRNHLAELFTANDRISGSARVVDALAQAANASRADVNGLAQALATGGPVAELYGLEIEETAAVLGVFANNGIMGAEAGTQLRSMLLNIARPTDDVKDAYKELGVSLYDTNGDVRDFNEFILELNESIDALPVEQQNEMLTRLGGSYGIVGLSALRASNGIGDMLAEMENAPEAGLLAEAFMDTFAGKVEGLKGSFETLKIEALTPFMNEVAGPFVDRMTEILNSVTEWASANPELTVTIMQIGSALAVSGPALMGAGLAINNIGFAVKMVAPLFGLLTSPLGLMAGAGLVLAEVFDVDLRQAFEDVASAVLPALEEIRVWVVEEGFPAMVEFVQTTVIPLFERIGEAIRSAWEFIAPILGQMFNWFVTQGLPAISNFIRNTFIPALQRIGQIIGQVWDAVAPILAELFTWFVEDALPAIGEIIETVFIPLIEDIGTRIGEVWAVIEPVLRDLYNWFVTTALPAISSFIQSVFIPAVQGIAHIFSEIYQTVAPILQFLVEWFVTKAVPIIAGIINDVIIPAIGSFINVLGAIWNVVAPVLQMLVDWFQATGWPLIEGIINTIITPAIEFLVGILKGIWEFVEPVINELVNWFNNVIAPVIEGAVALVTLAVDGFIAIFTGIWGSIQNSLRDVENWFTTTIAPVIDTAREQFIRPAVEAVANILKSIWDWARPGVEALRDGLNTIFTWIRDNIIAPVVNAILGIPNAVKEARAALDIFTGQAEIIKQTQQAAITSTKSQHEIYWNAYNETKAAFGGGLFGDIAAGVIAPNMTNTVTAGRNQAVGSGLVNAVNTFIPPLKDNGGIGLGDMPYLIGRPQEDNEIFVPRTDGHFIPNFIERMDALFDREQSPTIGQVVIHANTEEGGRAAARGFVDEFEKWNRSRG